MALHRFWMALVGIAAIGLATAAGAGSVRAEVDARKIGLDDRLRLTVTLEGGEADVSPPELENLQVLNGPSVASQISVVNGAISQSKSLTWVLGPTAVGTGKIARIRAAFADGEKSTEPIAVEIVAGSVRPRSSPDPFGQFQNDPFEGFFGRRRNQAPQEEPELFVEARPSRTKLYVGEPLLVTYHLFTQVSVTGIQFDGMPSFPGFWSEELAAPKEIGPGEVVTVRGERFHRFEISRKLLYPTKAGPQTIPAAKLQIGVAGRASFFDIAPGQVVVRATDPIRIDIQPLPEAPGFDGAVGHFEYSARVDRSTVALGEAATLEVSIKGAGNLKWIERAPTVVVPGAKIYPPEAKTDIKAGPDGLSGSRTWSFVVVPETAQQLEIPPLELAYFDPARKDLVRKTTTPLTIEVAGSAPANGFSAPAPVPIAGGGGPRLRSELDLPTGDLPTVGPRAVAAALALALLAHLAIWGLPRLTELRRGGTRATRASLRSAVVELKRAARGDLPKESAAVAIEKTIFEIFGDVDEGEPTNDGEREAREILQEVRFIRYAPQLGDYSEKVREVADRAMKAVKRWG